MIDNHMSRRWRRHICVLLRHTRDVHRYILRIGLTLFGRRVGTGKTVGSNGFFRMPTMSVNVDMSRYD